MNQITKKEEKTQEKEPDEVKNEITQEEIEGFLVVKSILRQKISSERITYRIFKTCIAILLDDSNRKAVCWLYLKSSHKFIGIRDEEKKEIKNSIETLDDIYNFSEQLNNIVEKFM